MGTNKYIDNCKMVINDKQYNELLLMIEKTINEIEEGKKTEIIAEIIFNTLDYGYQGNQQEKLKELDKIKYYYYELEDKRIEEKSSKIIL